MENNFNFKYYLENYLNYLANENSLCSIQSVSCLLISLSSNNNLQNVIDHGYKMCTPSSK